MSNDDSGIPLSWDSSNCNHSNVAGPTMPPISLMKSIELKTFRGQSMASSGSQ